MKDLVGFLQSKEYTALEKAMLTLALTSLIVIVPMLGLVIYKLLVMEPKLAATFLIFLPAITVYLTCKVYEED
jgi:hypothetical protein